MAHGRVFRAGGYADPVQNADYAASFLLDLYAAHQSWDGAVKHYHSSDPAKHVQYHARVLGELETILRRITPRWRPPPRLLTWPMRGWQSARHLWLLNQNMAQPNTPPTRLRLYHPLNRPLKQLQSCRPVLRRRLKGRQAISRWLFQIPLWMYPRRKMQTGCCANVSRIWPLSGRR